MTDAITLCDECRQANGAHDMFCSCRTPLRARRTDPETSHERARALTGTLVDGSRRWTAVKLCVETPGLVEREYTARSGMSAEEDRTGFSPIWAPLRKDGWTFEYPKGHRLRRKKGGKNIGLRRWPTQKAIEYFKKKG